MMLILNDRISFAEKNAKKFSPLGRSTLSLSE
jgi:hypothetical protein